MRRPVLEKFLQYSGGPFFLDRNKSFCEWISEWIKVKKRNRLKKNEDFQKVFKRGTSMANRQFVLYTLDQPKQEELR